MGKNFQMKLDAPNIKSRNHQEEKRKSSGTEKTESAGSSKGVAIESRSQEIDSEKLSSILTDEIERSVKSDREETGRKLEKILNQTKNENPVINENPFLQTKEYFNAASVIKTGYKMRVEYKHTLKLLAEIKKGYTIEALLDDALTMYLQNTPEAQAAINMLRTMMK